MYQMANVPGNTDVCYHEVKRVNQVFSSIKEDTPPTAISQTKNVNSIPFGRPSVDVLKLPSTSDLKPDQGKYLNNQKSQSKTPSIVIDTPKSTENVNLGLTFQGIDTTATRKSPVTVQEWVDSLPADSVPRSDVDIEEAFLDRSEGGGESLDLGLGAEAAHLYASTPISKRISLRHTLHPGVTQEVKTSHREGIAREASIQSDVTSYGSHGSSVESFLEGRKPDPEEILMNLGFGGPPLQSEVTRIPQRFLQPSKVKGVAIDEFLRKQQDLVETFESGFHGYRGLVGPSIHPSSIVAKILERLRERADDSNIIDESEDMPDLKSAEKLGRFCSVANSIIQQAKVHGLKSVGSVLSPNNRFFLESQGSKSPEIPRKMIIGQRTYTFSDDGDLIEDTSRNSTAVQKESRQFPKPLVHKDSIISVGTNISTISDDSDSDSEKKDGAARNIPQSKSCCNENLLNFERNSNNNDDLSTYNFFIPQEIKKFRSLGCLLEEFISKDISSSISLENIADINARKESVHSSLPSLNFDVEGSALPCELSNCCEDLNHSTNTAGIKFNIYQKQHCSILNVTESETNLDKEQGNILPNGSNKLYKLIENFCDSNSNTSENISLNPKQHQTVLSKRRGSLKKQSCIDEYEDLQFEATNIPLEQIPEDVSGFDNLSSEVQLPGFEIFNTKIGNSNLEACECNCEFSKEENVLGFSSSKFHNQNTFLSFSLENKERNEVNAAYMALSAYSSQLNTKINIQDTNFIHEAQLEMKTIEYIREQISSELRRVATLLEELPSPNLCAVTNQLSVLLHQQAKLCKQIELLTATGSSDPVPCCLSNPWCSHELILNVVREENRRLEQLVEGLSCELTEIKQLVKEMGSKGNKN